MNSLNNSQTELTHHIEHLNVHSHLCMIYRTQEEFLAGAIPFMQQGLERGEKCIYIADITTTKALLDAMRNHNIDVESAIESGLLVPLSGQGTFLRSGTFDPDGLIYFLKAIADSAKSAGYPAVRIAGDMIGLLGCDPDINKLLEFEVELDYLFSSNDILAIFQYDFNRFKTDIILHVIRTHLLVVFGELVCNNSYYVPPDDFLKPGQASREVDRLLGNILDMQHIEETLHEVYIELEQHSGTCFV